VLLIEDNEDDATIIIRELQRAGYEAVAERVATADGLRAALAGQIWDLISCDYNLPGFSALAALALIREHDGNVPVVVVSGEIGEELTVSLIRAGADDLVLKHNLGRLPGAVEHALRAANDRRLRAAAEAALQEEARISAALARVGQECVASLDTAALLQRVCRSTTEVLGCDYSHAALWDPEEQAFTVVAGDDTPEHWQRVRMLKLPLALIAEDAAQLRRDGIVHAGPAELAGDSTAAVLAAATGVTASLLVPLWRGEELIGIHTAGCRRPGQDFAPWQLRAAAGIGHLTSLALDSAHLLDRLTRSDRIKSEFLSTMSHELRTPLNHIIGFNDLLLEEPEHLTAEQTDMLQTIGRSSRELLALVNGVLDAQRLEAAPATAPVATDVAELVRQVTTTASVTSDLHMGCQLPPELPTVHTDPAKLKAVLQNLIGNAVKFTPYGSVTISAEPQDNGVLFTVADSGVGIPQELLPIIFEPFRQGDASLTRQHDGVGLGLYIVRREVDLLGGEVTVESEVGRGSTFRVWIPCEQRPRIKPAADTQRDASTLYAEVLDATSDLVYTVTPAGRLLYANRAWQAALGYESDELRALSLDDIVHPQSRAVFHQARQRALGGDPIQGLHVKYIAKDGRTLELEGSIRCRFANGEPLSMLCVYQNVTERSEAQRQAEARQQLLETILTALPVGVWITDATGRIIQGNPAAQRIWGGARYVGIEEYGQYKGWFAASGQPIAAEEWPAARAIQRGETTINEELEIESFHGIRKTILQSAVPLCDAVGEIAGAIIVDHVITALKQAEQVLRDSEQRFRTLIAEAADGIYVFDKFGLLAEVNAQGCEHLGYSRDELIGRPPTDVDQQLDPDRLRQHLLQLESGAPVLINTVHRRKDGSTFPVEIRSVRITWNGQPHILGICRDVTERKQAEEALCEAQASLQLATESAKVAVWKCNLRTLTIRFSSGWKRVLGRDEGELTLAALWDLVHPDDRAKTTAAMQEHLQGRAAAYETEQRMLHADGSYRWVLSRGVVVHDTEGRPAHWFGADIDVTERKRIELALREAQISAQMSVESAKVAVWRSDLRTLTIRFSSGWKHILGREEGEIPLAALWDLVHPDDRARATAVMQEQLQERTSLYENEQRMLHADGSYRWVLTRSTITYDIEGRPCGQYGADIDITERKALEEALRRSEEGLRALTATLEQQVADRTRELVAVNERLRLITDNMLDMLSHVSPEWVFQYVSPAHERVLGYAPQQMVGKSVLDFLHPDDVAPVTAVIEASIRNASSGQAEFRCRHADGHYVWVEAVGRLLLDDHGVPVGAVLNGRDVSERRRAESALRESEDRYHDLVENSQDLICTHDLEGNLLSVNEPAVRVTGYCRDALLHMNLRDLLAPEVRARFGVYLAEIQVRGQARGLMRIRTAGGESRYWEYNNTLRRDGTAGPIVRGMVRDITERRRAEERLRLQSAALDAAANAMAITDRAGVIQWANPAFTRLTGYTLEEAIGKNPRALVKSGQHDRAFYKNLWDTILGGQVWRGEMINRRKDGSLYTEEQTITPVHERGEIRYFITIKENVTERRQLEAQLRQSQKMEAVGRLAGGVAHDFNNQIFVINGYCDVLLAEAAGQQGFLGPLAEIKKAAHRSAELTAQLLAFSRKQLLQPKVLDLHAELVAIETMLRRLIGEDVQLTFLLGEDVGHVKADPNQLQQVVMNLAVNARDAMPHGGKLTIETNNVELDEAYAQSRLEVTPGRYVVLSVSDTGHGMDRETLAHVFEPFFTTKEPGKGTGLGLATALGVVKQSGGHIAVYSEPGGGTTFKIYLPRVDEPVETTERRVPEAPVGGSETILLVEDEAAVRELVRRVLSEQGYQVLPAADGKEALPLADRHDGPIHLLLTDVVMPEMSGSQLAERLKAVHPETRVLYMSGYTENAIVHHGVLQAGLAFILKPCPTDVLVRKVREILDARPRKDLRGSRILVVDDSEDERILQARVLSTAGCVVLEAAGGAEALELLEREAVDAVITDVNMPGMDGFTLTEAIRCSARLWTLPVIILSGACTEDEQARSRAVGATACLNKGVTDQQGLLEILGKVL